MDLAAIIPARMGSTRYPGKPLCDIEGRPIIEHVQPRTRMSDSVDATFVATLDEAIRDAVQEFGGEVIMTGSHTRATDRVAEAARRIDAEIVVVMQGDEPLVYPDMLDDAIKLIKQDDDVKVTNLGKRIRSAEDYRDPNNVKVVVDTQWNALYLSRSPIPNLYEAELETADVYHQVCVILFRRDFLFTFLEMEETPLEQTESIDMLRLLENGHDVRIVEINREMYPVDTPEDHERVNQLIAKDELHKQYADE